MVNIVDFETRAVIEQQAREWLIRLDGDKPLTGAERVALRDWLKRSPVHRHELVRLSKFWHQANVLTELAVPMDHPAGQWWPNKRLLMAAAATLAAVALAVAWMWHSVASGNGIYATGIGQQQTIALSDGSSIRLNTDSQVQVAYNARSRKIRLLRGEALFSVAREPERPFEVHAADGVVRAVGTAFSVHLEGSRVDVTVTHGIVDVAQSQGSLPMDARSPESDGAGLRTLGRLEAGQTTAFGNGASSIEILQLAKSDLQRRLAWHEGYLVFSGQPLSDAIAQINRYSPISLQIADPSIALIAVGGRFRIGDLDAVLEVLQTDFHIESIRIDERTIRLRRASPRPTAEPS